MLVAATCTDASADPVPPEDMPSGYLHLVTRAGVLALPQTDTLPPRSFVVPQDSHVYDGPTWKKLDTELKRLQESEVRLTAENKSFRETAKSWQPGWKILAGALVTGFAGGVYVHSKF